MKDKDIDFLKTLIIKLDISIEAERNNVSADGLMLIFDFTEKNRKESITKALDILNRTQNKWQKLKEFADKLDEEFGKNVEPTLSERADNIIALHRSNKKYCEIADEKIKELKLQLAEKDKEIEGLKTKQELTFMHSKEDYFQRCNLLEEANIKLQFTQTQLAIQELEKVNGILTDTIIEVTQNEFDLNKLCYLEEISAKFYEKIQQQIKDLKEE